MTTGLDSAFQAVCKERDELRAEAERLSALAARVIDQRDELFFIVRATIYEHQNATSGPAFARAFSDRVFKRAWDATNATMTTTQSQMTGKLLDETETKESDR